MATKKLSIYEYWKGICHKEMEQGNNLEQHEHHEIIEYGRLEPKPKTKCKRTNKLKKKQQTNKYLLSGIEWINSACATKKKKLKYSKVFVRERIQTSAVALL